MSESDITEADYSAQLVERIQNGDLRAETEMVDRYGRGLIAILTNKSKDRFLAEDVAQDTWLLVIQKVRENKLKDKTALRGFIIGIAKNQLIMRYRGINKYTHVSDEEVLYLADKGPSPEQIMRNKQLGHTITDVLSGLKTDRDRDLLRRFYLLGDDKRDLCTEFDLTAEHFDRVMFRARERFKSSWEKSQGGNNV